MSLGRRGRGQTHLPSAHNVDQVTLDSDDISGSKPAVFGKGDGVGLGVIMVTLCDDGTAEQSLAGLTWLDIAPLLIHKARKKKGQNVVSKAREMRRRSNMVRG